MSKSEKERTESVSEKAKFHFDKIIKFEKKREKGWKESEWNWNEVNETKMAVIDPDAEVYE